MSKKPAKKPPQEPRFPGLPDRLKRARAWKGMPQRGLAKAMGLKSGAAPALWESGGGIDIKNLRKAASALDVEFGWLAFNEGEGPPPTDELASQNARQPLGASVRELNARAGMGGGGLIESETRRDGSYADPLKTERWVFPQSFMREVLHAPAGQLLVLEVQGDSMAPTIQSGERVVIDTGHRVPSPDGIYALRDRFDFIVVKRLQIRQDTPKVRIILDNPSHEVEDVGIDEITIVGRVICGLRRL